MNKFPRLLIISDVNIELTSAGSTLLYRLFEKYPNEKLCVLYSKTLQADRVLPNVQYVQMAKIPRLVQRLSITRFYPVASFFEYVSAGKINETIAEAVESFKPDAIISVTFRFRWITAYKVAKKYKLPLHLILHDDTLTAEKHGRLLKDLIKKNFKKAYRFATSRFCISPNMEGMYREKFGAKGQVIYPTFGKDDIIPDLLPRIGTSKKALRFCYAGALYSADFARMLDLLAKVLKEEGHVLTIFTHAGKEDLATYKHLQSEHVEMREFVHPKVLREFMKNEVDVNILLNSFEEEEPFRWNFSSKMIEYVLVTLPVLCWGPSSSGAIDWALKNNYEAVLCEYSPEKLRMLVRKFMNTNERIHLAKHLLKIGADTFSFEKNYDVFINGIKN
jgi:hypothetical protein